MSSLSRNTQGVTLIKLGSGEKLVGLERVQEPSDEEGDDDSAEEDVGNTEASADNSTGTSDAEE